MTDRQVGVFVVPMTMIHEKPNDVAKVFSMLGFVAIRAEILGSDIEYMGICDRFEEVASGGIPPVYILEVGYTDDGVIYSVDVRKTQTSRILAV